MFKMIGVVAVLEREMIVERTKAGLAASRSRGRSGGRPKTDQKKIGNALKLYDSQNHSIAEIEEMTGVKKATLYRAINNRKSSEKVEIAELTGLLSLINYWRLVYECR